MKIEFLAFFKTSDKCEEESFTSIKIYPPCGNPQSATLECDAEIPEAEKIAVETSSAERRGRLNPLNLRHQLSWESNSGGTTPSRLALPPSPHQFPKLSGKWKWKSVDAGSAAGPPIHSSRRGSGHAIMGYTISTTYIFKCLET